MCCRDLQVVHSMISSFFQSSILFTSFSLPVFAPFPNKPAFDQITCILLFPFTLLPSSLFTSLPLYMKPCPIFSNVVALYPTIFFSLFQLSSIFASLPFPKESPFPISVIRLFTLYSSPVFCSPTPLSWLWFHLILLVPIVTTGYVLSSDYLRTEPLQSEIMGHLQDNL